MPRLLHSLGLFAVHKRWLVIVVWIVALALLGGLIRSEGAETSNNLDLPGSDSQAATDLLAKRFPPQQNGKNPIVFHTATGKVTDAAHKAAIEQSRQRIVAIPEVYSATSPFSQQGQAQISDDRRTAFIPVLLKVSNADLGEDLAEAAIDAGEPAVRAGMEVAAAGQIGSDLSKPETESSEVIGLATATLILAFTFGSMVAMGLPTASALVGLLVGLSLIGLLGHVTEVPEIGPTLATMIGLGVGIDYALFLLTRFRGARAGGLSVEESVATAVATSGTAIVFAGTTVIAALVTLVIAGIPLVTSLGYSAAVAVLTAMLAAITLLPAILGVLGDRADALRLPFGGDRRGAEAGGFWTRWARFVVGHPSACVVGVLAVLAVLTIPFLSLDMGQEDVGATPKDTTERQAYDLISNGYGVGWNGPLLVAVELGSPAKPSKEYEQQYKQATSLQSTLEKEQSQGQAQAADLEAQSSDLQGQQAALESQGAALQSQAAGLSAEQTQLQASRSELEQRRELRDQLEAIVAEAKSLARAQAQLAGEAAGLRRALAETRAQQARIAAQLAGNPRPAKERRLERRQARLEAREAQLARRLETVEDRREGLERQAGALARQAASLRTEASALGADAAELAAEAEAAAAGAVSLSQQQSSLEAQGEQLQVQAADLQAQQAQLEATQQVAKIQKQQAEQLKQQLTKELTAAGGDDRGTDKRLVALQNGLNQTIGVDLVSPPQINKAGNAAIFTVIAKTAPADPKTAELVTTIREYVIPTKLAGTDADAHVGGQTAAYVDLAAGISSRLGLVILAVLALGFLVLMVAFRSLLIPLQATLANLFAVCASFGVLTACFQWGWGLDLVGLDTASGTDPIASFVPLIMFAVLFGLSMDYQVFLLSQIEQHRATTGTDEGAVRGGLAAGGRVVGAAALIMISVFASFILNGDPTVKQFGVGLAVGVALAALCALILTPAILRIAGRASFWVPAWADRWLPHLDIEGTSIAQAAGASADGPQRQDGNAGSDGHQHDRSAGGNVKVP